MNGWLLLLLLMVLLDLLLLLACVILIRLATTSTTVTIVPVPITCTTIWIDITDVVLFRKTYKYKYISDLISLEYLSVMYVHYPIGRLVYNRRCGRQWWSGRASTSRTKGPEFEYRDDRVLRLGFFHTNGANSGFVSRKQTSSED